jgi:hypothetical protein
MLCSNNNCSSSLVACQKATHDPRPHFSLDIVYTNLVYSRPPTSQDQTAHQPHQAASQSTSSFGRAEHNDTYHEARIRVTDYPGMRPPRVRNNCLATAPMQPTIHSSRMHQSTVIMFQLCNTSVLLTSMISDVFRNRVPDNAECRQLSWYKYQFLSTTIQPFSHSSIYS